MVHYNLVFHLDDEVAIYTEEGRRLGLSEMEDIANKIMQECQNIRRESELSKQISDLRHWGVDA